ncbi:MULTISPECIES: hypothetical protein [Kitasatospora]|uniref:Lipoprotein n=1 Tax=Kitasatospora cathayae TaxID=3004092 RepID=A0ABY7Q9R6_9ACTN|nr:hypothetical protein [Kitasatospora sp. HUAS 3-15]WBP89393.1 hypothetical protein O1G21_28510 [Kitasatospora sp. HUAS 3-15]
MRNSTRLVTTTAAALLLVGALSACGPDNSGQDAGKTAAPAPTGAAPTAAPTGAPATGGNTGGSTAKPTGSGADKGIPAKAWMDTKSIPMDETYHYAPLAANAKPVTGAINFKGMELCHSPLPKGEEYFFTGGDARAKASVGFGGDRWTAQQTLLFWGDPTHSSGNGQSVGVIRDLLTEAVKDCAKTAPGATVTVAKSDDFAATVTVPQPDGSTVTLHEYVINAGGTVSELSVWATTKAGAQPKDAWKAPEDKYVATGMTAAICEALPGCN